MQIQQYLKCLYDSKGNYTSAEKSNQKEYWGLVNKLNNSKENNMEIDHEIFFHLFQNLNSKEN